MRKGRHHNCPNIPWSARSFRTSDDQEITRSYPQSSVPDGKYIIMALTVIIPRIVIGIVKRLAWKVLNPIASSANVLTDLEMISKLTKVDQ